MTPFENFKNDYEGKKILIMGLGLQGRGLNDALFFHKIGARVKITDLKSEKDLLTSLKMLKGLKIDFTLGGHKKEDFANVDLVIKNAGVPYGSPFLDLARKNKIKIRMDEALFSEYFKGEIIGVTGTRGKTTTATLIYEILKAAKKDVFLAGNILGKATLPLLEKVKENSLVVLELSSWQLQGFDEIKFSPHIAVVTNIYQDHLNYYKNMTAYIKDKKIIYKYQKKNDFIILNDEDKILKGFAKEIQSRVFYFSSLLKTGKKTNFSSPKGENTEGGQPTVVYFNKKDLPKDWVLKLLGEHNKENVAAAIKTVQIYHISQDWIKAVVTIFQGLPFRLQKIADVNGVAFINDTTSTTPVAGIKALETIKGKVILLAGGASKNLNLDDFARKISVKTEKVVLLSGTATEDLKKLIIKNGGKDKILGCFDDFEKAIKMAFSQAKAGFTILLSPGCASFGMFKNEFDRGIQFNKFVRNLQSVYP